MKAASFCDTHSLCSSLPLHKTKYKRTPKICDSVHYKFMVPSSLKLGLSSSRSRQGFVSYSTAKSELVTNNQGRGPAAGFDNKKASVGCVATSQSGSVSELIEPEEAEELMQLSKVRDNCKERSGVVELLECLEREAIMGEDAGREPNDYNRRAQIFDKSSRVFQALKQLNNANANANANAAAPHQS